MRTTAKIETGCDMSRLEQALCQTMGAQISCSKWAGCLFQETVVTPESLLSETAPPKEPPHVD
jgi:hypothetical protein